MRKATSGDLQMFGMSTDDIREQYMNSITAKLSGLEMVVAGILSDCQEMIAMKNPTIPAPNTDEMIRKQLNVAKFILFEMMDQNDVRKQYAKRKKEIAKDKRYGGFTV
jgi:hypothetical protein